MVFVLRKLTGARTLSCASTAAGVTAADLEISDVGRQQAIGRERARREGRT
jgi:hypothetical protein